MPMTASQARRLHDHVVTIEIPFGAVDAKPLRVTGILRTLEDDGSVSRFPMVTNGYTRGAYDDYSVSDPQVGSESGLGFDYRDVISYEDHGPVSETFKREVAWSTWKREEALKAVKAAEAELASLYTATIAVRPHLAAKEA